MTDVPHHSGDPSPRRPPTRSPDRPRRLRQGVCVFIRVAVVAALSTVVITAMPLTAHAAEPGPMLWAADSIQEVANNIRLWLVGILVAVASVFLTIAGLLYMTANGDPGQNDKARMAFRSALIGYGLAALAPLFVSIVGEWVS